MALPLIAPVIAGLLAKVGGGAAAGSAAGAGASAATASGASVASIAGNLAGRAASLTPAVVGQSSAGGSGVRTAADGLLGVGKGAKEAVLHLKEFAEKTAENNRSLSRLNGTIAGSFAQMDRQKLQLDRETANRTASSTKTSNSALMELRRDLRPLQSIAANAKNMASTLAARLVSVPLKMAKPIVEAIDKMMQKFSDWWAGKRPDDMNPTMRFFREIANGNYSRTLTTRPDGERIRK